MRVKTKFEADDNISKVARRIEKNIDRMNRSIQKGFKSNNRAAKSFAGTFKGILAAGGVQQGFGLIQQGAAETVRQFASFDDAITAAAVRFKDIGPDAVNFKDQLNQIKLSAREAGQTTTFTATEAARALDFLARAGFTSAEAMGSLGSMINLAIASGEDFASVANWSSDLLGAFGLAVDDSAQKVKNLARLNDVLVKTSNSANVTIEDMFETMKTIGPIASGILKVSLEDVAAQTAILGNSGIKGTVAMTALKNAYLNLAAPAGDGAKIMKMFNLTLKDGKGGVKTLTDVLQELNVQMQLKGIDPVDQAKVMDAIFGKRAIAGAKNLMDNIKNVEKFKETLDKAGGTAQKTANVMKTSLGNEVKSLGSAFLEFGFTILDPWEQDMKNAIKGVTEFARDSTTKLKQLQKEQKKQGQIGKLKTGLTEEENAAFSMGFMGGTKSKRTFTPNIKSDAVQDEMTRMFMAVNPTFNIAVNQDINPNANVEVDTTIDAPGGSGKVTRNKF